MYSTDGILTFSFPLGQWLGARVRVSFLLPVLLLAMMWRLQDLPWGMVAGILLLYSLLLHELAHLIVLRMTGGDVEDIIIWPVGGLSSPHPGPGLRSELQPALAGPIANALIAAVCAWPLHQSGLLSSLWNPFQTFTIDSQHSLADTTLRIAFYFNWCLLLLNLLPVTPLDGGQVVRSILNVRFAEAEVRDLMLRFGLVMSLFGLLAGFVFDLSGLVAVSAFIFILHLSEAARHTPPTGQIQRLTRDEFSGYDFSSQFGFSASDEFRWDDASETSYLSERNASDDSGDHWQSRKDEYRLRRELEQLKSDELQLDEILEKLHHSGRDALNNSELAVLNRMSERLRQRNSPA
ncbi:MAG: site-2 protease family protein [Planctomycetaceae bacterium]|nr:site-2 protease family protein [Planctomycetaceae bacterium]